MGEAPSYLLFALLHVVVPACGLFVAGMLAVGRVTAGTCRAATVYAVVAAVVTAWTTIAYWWPSDAFWDGFHLAVAALCLLLIVLVLWLRRAPAGSTAARVLRPLVVACLFVSAIGYFIVVSAGSGR